MIEVLLARSDQQGEAGLTVLRERLPPERRRRSDRFLREEDRAASVLTFALLQQAWRAWRPGPMPALRAGRWGKPEFVGEAVPFLNLSHDPPWCACAMAEVPVGIDVQGPIPIDRCLLAQITSPAERSRMSGRSADGGGLAPMWTRKEAVVKCSGVGIASGLSDVDVSDPEVALTLEVASPTGSAWVSIAARATSAAEVLSQLALEIVEWSSARDAWVPSVENIRLAPVRSIHGNS